MHRVSDIGMFFEDDDAVARAGEAARRHQPGRTGAYDEDIIPMHAVQARPSRRAWADHPSRRMMRARPT
jgi:hypothetical protein